MSQSLLFKGKAASVLPCTIYAKELDVEMTTTAGYDASLHSMQEVYYLKYFSPLLSSISFRYISVIASLSDVNPAKSKANHVVFEANVRRVIRSDNITAVATC
jgi:hypothetical protein